MLLLLFLSRIIVRSPLAVYCINIVLIILLAPLNLLDVRPIEANT